MFMLRDKNNKVQLNLFIVIIISFILIILITSIVTLYNLDHTLDKTTTQFTNASSEIVQAKTIGYLNPIELLNTVIYEIDLVDAEFMDNVPYLNLVGESLLSAYPQLQAFIIGNQSGDFYMLRLEQDGTFTQRLIRPNANQNKVIDSTYSSDFDLLTQKISETVDFDPRVRPWYVGAKETGESFWTDLYLFHASQMPGITISHPFYDEHHDLIGVFGFDINVYQLSQFLSNLEFSSKGELVLINQSNKIIAYSQPDVIFKNNFEMKTIDIDNFNKPEVNYILNHTSPQNPVAIFKLNGIEYVGLVRHLNRDLGVKWKIVLVVPTNEFLEAYRLTSYFMAAVTFMIIILITLLIFYRLKELKSSAALFHYANYDPLTSLYNRNYFNQYYNSSLGKAYALIISDIDHFKVVNDTYGHNVGDLVLQEIAKLFKSHLKAHQVAFRWGGEEFLILLENENLSEAVELAESLRRALESKTFEINQLKLNITMSFGVSEHLKEHSFQEIVHLADMNLYKAKESGRNKVIY